MVLTMPTDFLAPSKMMSTKLVELSVNFLQLNGFGLFVDHTDDFKMPLRFLQISHKPINILTLKVRLIAFKSSADG